MRTTFLRILGLPIFAVYLCILIYGCSDDSGGTNPNTRVPYSQIDFEPSWSKQDVIAYTHSDQEYDNSGIYTINYDGTNLRHLISGYASSPDWSPDGEWIAFVLNDQIFKVKLQNDSVVRLTSTMKNSSPKWSPWGNKIFFILNDGTNFGTYSINSDGSQQEMIYSGASYVSISGLNSVLLLVPARDEYGNLAGDTLIKFDYVNLNKEIITVLNGDEHKLNSYPVTVENEIIFCSIDKEGYSYIYKVSSAGTNKTKLTTSQSYSPDYSQTNKKIIYTNRNQGNGRLWTMDRNGGNNLQFTH